MPHRRRSRRDGAPIFNPLKLLLNTAGKVGVIIVGIVDIASALAVCGMDIALGFITA